MPGINHNSHASGKNLYSVRHSLPLLPLPTAIVAALLVCLLSSFSGVFMLNYEIITAFALSAASGAVFTLLIILCRKVWILFTAPVAAAAVAAFSSGKPDSVFGIVFSLTFVVVGITLAACVYLGRPCSSTILSVSLALAPWIFLCLIFFILLTPGLYNFNMPVRENLSNIGSKLSDGIVSSLLSFSLTASDGTELVVFSYDAASQIVRLLALLSPSIIILSVMSVAFASSKILYGFFLLFGITDLLRYHKWAIVPQKSTAVIYCVSYAFSLIFQAVQNSEGFYFAMYNLSVIMSAPLAIFGFNEIIRRISKNSSVFTKISFIVLSVIIAVINFSVLLVITAFFGVFTVFKKHSPKQSD